MRLRNLLPLLIFSFAVFAAHGQNLRDEIAANPDVAGGIYYAYSYDNPVHTDAPKGYKPFYISHYGRHGSRWLIADSDYSGMMEIFDAAKAANALTPKGLEVYDRVRTVYEDGFDRAGALTPLGAQQHREIAQRMYRSYPEVFRGEAVVNAEATIIVRCVLSMAAFCEQLKVMNPKLQISRDADRRTTRYLEFFYGPLNSPNPINVLNPEYNDILHNGEWLTEAWDMLGEGVDMERIISMLFSDASYAAGLDQLKLLRGLYFFAVSIQNVEPDVSFSDIFTVEDLYWFAVYDNYRYYVMRGPSSINKGYSLYYAKSLLSQIIERADKAIAGGGVSADLRFGHDVNLMPLVTLMQLEGCTADESEPGKVAAAWPVHRISPMAANVQMVFFRSKKTDDVLVKFLHNEREVRIPVVSDIAPYYRWDDVRTFYTKVMDDIQEPAVN